MQDSLPEAPIRTQPSWNRFRGWGLLIAAALAAFLLFALAAWTLLTKPPVNPFTAAIQASVSFPLFYPTKLPAGYRTDRQSVQQPENGVITFSVVKTDRPTIYVSEEAAPSKDVLNQFIGQLVRPTTIDTNLGPASYGGLPTRTAHVASLATGNKTWIIVNASNSVPEADFDLILKNLQH